MATTATEKAETLADLMQSLGSISPRRIRVFPPPGTATEADVAAALDAPRKRLFELIDGVLVEKAMGARESQLAAVIARHLEAFAEEHDRGVVLGADGALRLLPGLVRIPDVSFLSWEKLPNQEMPAEPVPALVPDLAVEVVSEGNTPGELKRKLREYFNVGIGLVWLIYPKTQTAAVYSSPTRMRQIAKNGTLEGGKVLPGFRLPLACVFACLRRNGRPHP